MAPTKLPTLLRKAAPPRSTVLSWLVFGGLLAVYVQTLLPGVGGFGDTPKFQFIGKVLGIPHSTGYPSYILLNHLFVSLLPAGTLAWKANLLSAVLGAAAGAVMFRLLLALRLRTWAAAAGGLLLGLTPTTWSQAVIAEVYTLHLLCVLLILLLLTRWRRTGDDRPWRLAVLVGAVALGNHLTTIFLAPAVLILIGAGRRRALLRPANLAWAGGGAILVAALYLLLFVRSHDPTTPYVENEIRGLGDLWRLLSGERFRPYMFSFGLQEIVDERLPLAWRVLWREFAFALPLAVLGAIRLRDRPLNAALLSLLLLHLLWFLNYGIPDGEVFLLPAFAVIVIHIAVGCHSLCELPWPPGRRGAAALFLALPLVFALRSWSEADQSGNTDHARRVAAVLSVVDRDAVIISPDYDWSESLWYHLLGEGLAERNLHVMHRFSAAHVAAYLQGRASFELPEQRRWAPLGLTVYCLTRHQAQELREAGLRLEPARAGMVVVRTR